MSELGRQEYEENREEDNKRSRAWNFWAAVLLSLTFILAVLTTVGTVVSANRSQQKDYDIRLGNYIACIVNGNSLREDIREEFVDLKEEAIIDPYNAVAAFIPEGTPTREVLLDTTQRLDRRIRTIEKRIPDVDCLKAYPPLEGQTYPNPDDFIPAED